VARKANLEGLYLSPHPCCCQAIYSSMMPILENISDKRQVDNGNKLPCKTQE
jgi:hypothetical protein